MVEVPNYYIMLISSSSVSGRLKSAAYKLTKRIPITSINFNIVLVVYQRDKNEADCQIMYEKQSRSHL